MSVSITAFGSAYYHLHPNDKTLIWDRVPMAAGFMALLSAVVCERINVRNGLRLLVPLVTLGVGSTAYWAFTQTMGRGDLRPYALVQFGSPLVLLLILGLFPQRYNRGSDLVAALAIYVFAKVLEASDVSLLTSTRVVSGHTVKHVTAAVSACWILRMLRLRRAIASPPDARAI